MQWMLVAFVVIGVLISVRLSNTSNIFYVISLSVYLYVQIPHKTVTCKIQIQNQYNKKYLVLRTFTLCVKGQDSMFVNEYFPLHQTAMVNIVQQ